MRQRVALLGIYHESNTFSDTLTTAGDFTNGHLLKGDDILVEYRSAHHEIGGMIEVMEAEGIEIVPVMYAEATPGGTISAVTYESLLSEMMDALEKVLPVDGCLVVPHGAAVSERYSDMDGHWLSVLREKVGNDIPIVGTLDPHANVSKKMVSSTNALVAYKTNPHIDQRATGREAARILAGILQQRINPVQTLVHLPLAISIEQQHTGSEPCRSFYSFVKNLADRNNLLSNSVILGFPYADVEEMGSAVILVSDKTNTTVSTVEDEIRSYISKEISSFSGKKTDVSAAISGLEQCEKPALFLDMGDNVGGGASGKSTFLLKALEDTGRWKFFICLHDPDGVSRASALSPGDHFTLAYDDTDSVHQYEVTLMQLADGRYEESDPRHGGQVHFDMGRIAIVSTRRGNVIMLTSLRALPFSLRQLTDFNIIPKEFDVIVAKGVNAPIAAYAPVCPTIIRVDTPGSTRADMRLFNYRHRRKPLFPFEEIQA